METNSQQMNLNRKTSGRKVGVILLGSIAVVALLFLLIMTASATSPLYGFKVTVVEKAIGNLYMSPSAQVDYNLKLLDRRVKETKALSERSAISEADANFVTEVSIARARSVIDLLAAHESTSFSRTEALLLTHQLQIKLRAQEELAEDSESLGVMSESIQELRREVAGIFDARAEQFIVHGTNDEVKAFLNQFLETVLAYAKDETMSDSLRKDTERSISRASESIAEGDIAAAISQIANALQDIELERYLGLEEEVISEETNTGTETDTGTSTTGTATTTDFSLSDVLSITSKWVDPDPMMADEEYNEYTILLRNGSRVEVEAAGFTTVEMRNQKFIDAGYTGDVEALLLLSTQSGV